MTVNCSRSGRTATEGVPPPHSLQRMERLEKLVPGRQTKHTNTTQAEEIIMHPSNSKIVPESWEELDEQLPELPSSFSDVDACAGEDRKIDRSAGYSKEPDTSSPTIVPPGSTSRAREAAPTVLVDEPVVLVSLSRLCGFSVAPADVPALAKTLRKEFAAG